MLGASNYTISSPNKKDPSGEEMKQYVFTENAIK